jgi:hypothetical protein
MATFSVNIQTNTTPAISVGMSGNTSYTQFKQSLGQYVYKVERIYLYSSNISQIQNVFLYMKYDSNGNQNFQNIISAISPYQDQSSIYLDLDDKNLIIDGRDAVTFKMLPNTSLQIKLYVYRISIGDTLDDMGINQFTEISDLIVDYDFFDDYKDML